MILDISFTIGSKELRLFLNIGRKEPPIHDSGQFIDGAIHPIQSVKEVIKEWETAGIIN